jgi:formate hydrogenlyase transcriptional activator
MHSALANERIAARYEALIRLAEVIRSHSEEGALLQTLASELHDVVELDGFCQFDGAGNWIQWHFDEPYKSGLEVRRPESVPKEETVAWWVYQNQQPMVVGLSSPDNRFPRMRDWLAKLGLKSSCTLPLSTAHRQLGSISFISHFEEAYSAEEQRFLSLVANQLALAMDDGRAQKRLRLLLDLTNRVMSKLELRDLLKEISASIRQIMHCDSVAVGLPDRETGDVHRYVMDFSDTVPHGDVDPNRPEIGESDAIRVVAQQVFSTGRSVLLGKEELAAEPRAIAMGFKCFCLVPLISRERVLGVLSLGSLRENVFTEDVFGFLGQAANQIALAVENASAYGEISQLKDRLARENVYLENEIRSELHFEDIVGNSETLHRVLREVETVAPADSTVLICGETGTGKELIARAVHNLSSRKANAFVKLNCAAIPTGLLESELFGHEKGAFTGAIMQRVGRFELAHRGTIFLDEIGEIPLELQPKLLRVLQEREFERLGSARTLRTDARLIAATNRDLKAMVEEQKFRPDLYYRLNVFPIRVPALRERREDILLLVRHFVQEFSRRNNRVIDTIPSETMEALLRYHWPGNIRELQNVIERAVIISKGPVLHVSLAELEPDVRPKTNLAIMKASSVQHESLQEALDETERARILRALEEANGVVGGPNGAATRLGIKRTTLHVRMQKLGIHVSRTAINGRR